MVVYEVTDDLALDGGEQQKRIYLTILTSEDNLLKS